MQYGVRSLPVGHADIPGPELFWMSNWSDWFPLTFQVVLIQGGGLTVLVNTGPAHDLAPMNELWVKILGERAPMRRSDDELITAALATVSVRPQDVTHLILTPLQFYTTSNVPLFTNAQICLSRRGWVHYHTTHAHPHDVRWNCIPRNVLIHMVTDAWDRVRLLEDDDEIAPGLRTWWAGGHHRATLAVEVDTAVGTVVISDVFFYYENVEESRVLGINENMYEALTAYERARTAAHRVPLYDPKVFERYAGGVIAPPEGG
jgi:hypothetical protein